MRPTLTTQYLLLVLIVAFLPGCSGSRLPSDGNSPISPACIISGSPASAPKSVRIVAEPPLPGHATLEDQFDRASHVVLGLQLYKNLFDADCSGNIRLTMVDKVEPIGRPAGLKIDLAPSLYGRADSIAFHLTQQLTESVLIDSIAATDDRTIHVYANLDPRDIQLLLADPVFGFPIADYTSPDDVVYSGRSSNSGELTLSSPSPTRGPSEILFARAESDLRDLLSVSPSSSQDVLALTSDPAVLDFTRLNQDFDVTQVQPGATYVIASTTRLAAIRAGDSLRTLGVADPNFRASLAGNALRVEAEAYPLDELALVPGGCALGTPAHVSNWTSSEGSAIVFDASDPVARAISERLVALARSDSDGSEPDAISAIFPTLLGSTVRPTAAGVTPTQFGGRLATGRDLAYVVRLDGSPLAQCIQLGSAAQNADWLNEGLGHDPEFAVPLVRLRQFVISRPNARPTMQLDHFGRIKFGESTNARVQ